MEENYEIISVFFLVIELKEKESKEWIEINFM